MRKRKPRRRFPGWLRGPLAALGLMGVASCNPSMASGRQATLEKAMESVVSVLAVDKVNGQIVPRANGSGTIVSSSGHVLTSWHVLRKSDNTRSYDLFLIGRFTGIGQPPELICAGSPEKAEKNPELDLAVIRCDRDLAGQPWLPSGWPRLEENEAPTVAPGQQVWILGYSHQNGGPLHVTAGLVTGWTGEASGTTGQTYIKTDATIAKGTSGGTAITGDGQFVGIPTAVRKSVLEHDSQVVAAGRVGLIRPAGQARDLVAVATKNHEQGSTQLRGRVRNVNNDLGVEKALVALVPPISSSKAVTSASLVDRAQAWTWTNWRGDYTFSAKDGSYNVAIFAAGFEPFLSTSYWHIASQNSSGERDFRLRPLR